MHSSLYRPLEKGDRSKKIDYRKGYDFRTPVQSTPFLQKDLKLCWWQFTSGYDGCPDAHAASRRLGQRRISARIAMHRPWNEIRYDRRRVSSSAKWLIARVAMPRSSCPRQVAPSIIRDLTVFSGHGLIN